MRAGPAIALTLAGMRTALLSNPRSGDGSHHHDELDARVAAAFGGPVDLYASDSGEAMLAAAEAVGRAGYERVIIAGGDGSVNLCINGLARAGALARVVLGILPAGTGNDLATFLGVPREQDAALAALAAARPIDLDLGEMNGMRFANASCGGYFGEVSEATSSGLKAVTRRLAYLLAGASVLLQHSATPTRLRAETELGPLEWEGTLSMFAVCNGMTVAGGRPLAPAASVSDGLLDACFVSELGPAGLAAVLLKMGRGEHLDDERVIGFRARSLELEFAEPVPVNLDGEVAPVERAVYRVHPAATRILAPEPGPGEPG